MVIVILVRLLVYSFYSDYTIYPDTESYINYEANILKGEVDKFRTPVYPNFIKFIDVFSENRLELHTNITYVQEIISIISVVILYKTLKNIFKNQSVNCFATILYGCLPSIFTYNRVILTESLSISFFVIYFCLVLKYITKPTNSKTILIAFYTLILIMLRPSFIYLIIMLPILFITIFICKKEYKKQALLGFGGLACIGIIILGYCYLNKVQNNIFAISNVTQINQLDTVIGMGIYNTGDKQDEGIINIINKRLDGYNSIWYRTTTNKIMEEYTPQQIDEYLSRCIKNNFSMYLNKTIEKIFTISTMPCNEIYLRAKTFKTIRPIINFSVIYILLFVEFVHIVFKSIKDKKISLEQIIMFITISGQLATIILGAQAEYSRLFVTVIPIMLLSIAWNIDGIIEKKSCGKGGKMKNIEMIIFDLDGTLWETMETTCKSANEIMKKHNIDHEITKETVANTMGCNFEESAKNYMPDIEREKRLLLMKEITDYNSRKLAEEGGNLYQNLEETLKKLKEKYKLAIVSNCGPNYIESFLESSKLGVYFDDFAAASKMQIPKGEAIRKVMERNNIENAIYVGDTQKDYEASKMAGIDFIHAKYGFAKQLEFEKYIDSIEQLPNFLEKII